MVEGRKERRKKTKQTLGDSLCHLGKGKAYPNPRTKSEIIN